ncbi:protein of unknown function DUF1611 [Gloeothece citriformis PCC 7424]|uniref:DUF1611 domain-containing protein n=1 Tax=Gloeothece citriformis (strain PCC 7424) TaxID=65393 RepID=B7KGQ0_GLOC7|nr:DUF1611 domain-containing protein [Gloeothece citriformis]ACK71977.1 protein of unknown function DUF1611 [Gloeothece citriformis PCC 7424]
MTNNQQKLTSQHRVVILLHEGIKGTHGKTGLAYLRYGKSPIVAVIDSESADQSLPQLTKIDKKIPIVKNIEDALTYHPDVLLIGIAPSGGILPDAWLEEVKKAVKAGVSVVNGLHTAIAPQFNSLQENQWIWDIRQEPPGLIVGKARARSLSCRRMLTVGTDMSVGKMSTSLEINAAAQRRGIKSKFLATGQGGIMIEGDGIPLDAIRVDYAAGAVEQMVLKWGNEYDLLLVEGQGSLVHPGSTATLPLIRGSQPTDLILVHRAGQKHIQSLPQILIPPLSDVVQLYNQVASVYGTFGDVRVKAIALNTFHLDEQSAKDAIAQVETETGLPCTDVVRFGADSLLEKVY